MTGGVWKLNSAGAEVVSLFLFPLTFVLAGPQKTGQRQFGIDASYGSSTKHF